ncbi:hypothetical protein CI610_03351 [invertebrate metagenome]|uniref:Uncharacterized protein n=1 Tax=invertebrate metagenome TaxID=1711999 RepID=A0A2H9T3E4_9ZZZZ
MAPHRLFIFVNFGYEHYPHISTMAAVRRSLYDHSVSMDFETTTFMVFHLMVYLFVKFCQLFQCVNFYLYYMFSSVQLCQFCCCSALLAFSSDFFLSKLSQIFVSVLIHLKCIINVFGWLVSIGMFDIDDIVVSIYFIDKNFIIKPFYTVIVIVEVGKALSFGYVTFLLCLKKFIYKLCIILIAGDQYYLCVFIFTLELHGLIFAFTLLIKINISVCLIKLTIRECPLSQRYQVACTESYSRAYFILPVFRFGARHFCLALSTRGAVFVFDIQWCGRTLYSAFSLYTFVGLYYIRRSLVSFSPRCGVVRVVTLPVSDPGLFSVFSFVNKKY